MMSPQFERNKKRIYLFFFLSIFSLQNSQDVLGSNSFDVTKLGKIISIKHEIPLFDPWPRVLKKDFFLRFESPAEGQMPLKLEKGSRVKVWRRAPVFDEQGNFQKKDFWYELGFLEIIQVNGEYALAHIDLRVNSGLETKLGNSLNTSSPVLDLQNFLVGDMVEVF